MKNLNYANFVNLFLIILLILCCYSIRKDINAYEERIQSLENSVQISKKHIKDTIENQNSMSLILERQGKGINTNIKNLGTIYKIIGTNQNSIEFLLDDR